MSGSLLLKYETGGGLGPNKMVQVGMGLNDGIPHHVAITLQGPLASIAVDTSLFGSTAPSPNSPLPQFASPLFIGGFGLPTIATSFHLQSDASLVATISNFRINQQLLLYSSIVMQNEVDFAFLRDMNMCAPTPCSNGGQCVDLWTNYSCTCSHGYSGERCQVQNLAHYSLSAFSVHPISNVTNITYRFTTQQHSGVIMTLISVSKDNAHLKYDHYVLLSVYRLIEV